MKAFRKVYNLKMLALAVSITFLFSHNIYGAELHRGTSLRIPVSFDAEESKKRFKECYYKVSVAHNSDNNTIGKFRAKALSTSSFDEFMNSINEARERKGYLTTEKTFFFMGVYDFLEIDEPVEPTVRLVTERIKRGKELLKNIFTNPLSRKRFFDFALSYQYAYTHKERLADLVEKLIEIIKKDPDFSEKKNITILDIGTGPKLSGSPTAEKTLELFRKAFPNKNILLRAVDNQFPANYLFDEKNEFRDEKTDIVYVKYDIKQGSLEPADVVIAVNLLDLYKAPDARLDIEDNLFSSSNSYVVTGVESKEDIWKKDNSGWTIKDTVILQEGWYVRSVYDRLGFYSDEIKNKDVFLREDISVNYAFLIPLLKFLEDTDSSKYHSIFRFITLLYVRGELETFLRGEGLDKVAGFLDNFQDSKDYALIKDFITFVGNKKKMILKNKIETDSSNNIYLFYELVNLFVLDTHEKNPGKSKQSLRILLLQPRIEAFGHIPGYVPMGLAELMGCAQDKTYQTQLFSRLKTLPDVFEELLNTNMEFRLLDLQTEGPEFNLEKYLKDFNPQIVGMRTISISIEECERLARFTKETLGGSVKILFGGYHITALSEETMSRNKGIVDIGFLGEAEETFPHYLAMHVSGGDIASVPRLCYIDEKGDFIETDYKEPLMELDDYPSFVQYLDFLHNPEGYAAIIGNSIHGEMTSKIALMISERGCPVKCTFCPTHIMFPAKGIRYQTVEKVLNIMEEYYLKGYRIFFFRDDNFTTDRKRNIEISKGIIKKGWKIAWTCMSRADTVDRDYLKIMRDSGMSGIFFGVESGDEGLVRRMKKYLRLWKVREAHRFCRELGIFYKDYYMVGYPGENWKTVLKTLFFMVDSSIGFKNIDKQLQSYDRVTSDDYISIFEQVVEGIIDGRIDLASFLENNIEFPDILKADVNIAYCTPYPGSELHDYLNKEVWLDTDTFRHGPVERANLDAWESPIHTKDMARDELTEARTLMVQFFRAIQEKDSDTMNYILENVLSKVKKSSTLTNKVSPRPSLTKHFQELASGKAATLTSN